MPYPNISEIVSTIENRTFIQDSLVKDCDFIKNSSGNLLRYVGGFSAVFPYFQGNEKWAFRCWHSDLGSLQNRFSKISSAIEQANLPYFSDFSYVENGILVNGISYPTIRIKWIEGKTLKIFLSENLNNKNNLLEFANNFKKMCTDLHLKKIAHGDLQHGNIIVKSNNELCLIDYDSMYCPELIGEIDIIKGLKDYQHPNRHINNEINEKIDYFSELIIYLSVLSIANKTELFNKYNVKDTEYLLFNSNDFKNIENSEIYKDLKGIDDEIDILLEILIEYLKKTEINELDDFISLNDKIDLAPEIIIFKSSLDTIIDGQEITLSWDVKNFKKIDIENENGLFVDATTLKELIEKPNQTGKYIIHAKNYKKKATSTINIRIFPTPIIKSLLVPLPNILTANNISITNLNYNTGSLPLPKLENIKVKKYTITLNSHLLMTRPKIKELEYKIEKISLLNRIKNLYRILKKEFINEKNKRYVVEK